jgi:hypothetical protein
MLEGPLGAPRGSPITALDLKLACWKKGGRHDTTCLHVDEQRCRVGVDLSRTTINKEAAVETTMGQSLTAQQQR